MRDIKFRGMTLGGQWYIGDLSRPKNDISSSVTGGGSYISNAYGMPHAYPVRPETVGQYTGLKDKNGVEIYEGDIVNEQYHQSPSFIVEYKDGAFNPFDDFKSDIFYVTGNIHENPELLKGDK